MLADAELVAFVASADLERSEAFYGGVLGLELVDSTPFAKVFDAHGTQLRVTRVDAVAGAAYTVLGWRVDDLDAAVAALRSRGVEPSATRAGAGRERCVDRAGRLADRVVRGPGRQHPVAPAGP